MDSVSVSKISPDIGRSPRSIMLRKQQTTADIRALSGFQILLKREGKAGDMATDTDQT